MDEMDEERERFSAGGRALASRVSTSPPKARCSRRARDEGQKTSTTPSPLPQPTNNLGVSHLPDNNQKETGSELDEVAGRRYSHSLHIHRVGAELE